MRKDAQIEKLKGVFSEYAEKIEFVVVPDIAAPGAFDKVLDGVDYVLHLASPLAGSTKKEDMFRPALEGTMSILRSAKKVPSIKKVVITSSMIALEPLNGVPEGGVTRGISPHLSLIKEANANRKPQRKMAGTSPSTQNRALTPEMRCSPHSASTPPPSCSPTTPVGSLSRRRSLSLSSSPSTLLSCTVII